MSNTGFKKFIKKADSKKNDSEKRFTDKKKGFKGRKREDFKSVNENKAPKSEFKDSNKEEKRKKSKSRCPVFAQCGACTHIDVDYAEQLKIKQQSMIKLLGKYANVDDIIGMKDPYHYRCKVTSILLQKFDGSIVTGNYSERSHRIVPIENCYIEDAKADKIISDAAKLMASFKMKVFNDRNGYGNIRYMMVRMGKQTGQIMLIIVTRSPIMPSKNNFVKALIKQHPEITTIVQNINERTDSMILGRRDTVLYGKGYIEDKLCGKTFRISPQSFYQVNPVQTEHLYRKAIEVAGINKTDTVLDAYCGTGTIGIVASDKAKRVIGVELNSNAVRDANVNAKINNVENIEFYNQDAGEFLEEFYAGGEKADVVIMDPPRAGSDTKFLGTLLNLMPERIAYVSCNPITLERDLDYLTKSGKYKVASITPVDMFPFTEGVETVVALQRINT